MPIKKRSAKSKPHRITPEAIAAFVAGDYIALHRALGLAPWQCSPLDADDGPSPWPTGTVGADSWPLARALRDELRAAVGK